jgi:CubicO group peptidase (beta-lactamase class C family)
LNRSRHIALVLALLFSVVQALSAQAVAEQPEPLADQIERLLTEAYPDADAPGAALIAIDDGVVVYRGARGMANMELGIPLSADQVFRLGSITKQFTGAAIMMLEEQGKLAVSDPITKYLPNYPTHGHTITIEHLLTHTSGIYNYTNIPGYFENRVRSDLSTQELVEVFQDLDMDFAPGERWNYSNSGYVLLGAILEEVTGESYADFVQENIFEPLGMHDSHYGGPQLIPGRVAGYVQDGEGYVNAPYLSMTQPHAAGSLLSTVDDLTTWHAALASGELISPESYQRMTSPFMLNSGEASEYGYGFNVAEIRDMKAIHHGGGINGFVTFALWLPEEEIYVAALSNIPGVGAGPGQLSLKVGALLAGNPYPEFQRVELSEEILARYVGVYRIDDDTTRTVTLKDGELYTLRSNSVRMHAVPFSENGFFYPGELDYFEVVMGDDGTVSHMVMYPDGSKEGERADMTDEEPVVPEHPDVVSVDPAVYDRYVGRYELVPGFVLEVTRDGDRLFTQATNQAKVEVFPSSETGFFLKVVDARLEFELEGEGPAVAVTLFQAGQEVRGERLED